MILKTLAFTLLRPGLVVVLIPYLLLSDRGLAAALVLILGGRELVRLTRLTHTPLSAAPVFIILAEAAAFRSLTLLLYAPLVLESVRFHRVLAGPTARLRERPAPLLGTVGNAMAFLMLVPWLLLRAESLAGWPGNWRLVGLVPIALGAFVYFWCAWNFTFSGRGTPGPSRPSEELVVVGLYRLSRNPMYVAIVSILVGEAILFQSVTLLVYTWYWAQRFHFNIIDHEEPALRETFGAAYEEYRRSVPRWLPGIPDLDRRGAVERESGDLGLARKQPVLQATEEIVELIPPGEPFILVDQDEWGTQELVAGRRRIPFLEHEGQYWGPPKDDETAIRELERLRQAGAAFMVFGWPAFWWLEHYAGLQRHLRSQFRCLLENDRAVIFDLRTRPW